MELRCRSDRDSNSPGLPSGDIDVGVATVCPSADTSFQKLSRLLFHYVASQSIALQTLIQTPNIQSYFQHNISFNFMPGMQRSGQFRSTCHIV